MRRRGGGPDPDTDHTASAVSRQGRPRGTLDAARTPRPGLETPITAPAPQSERIVSIDVLRGFAVLGILIVNIQGFARVASAYMNPSSGRVLEGADLWTWAAVYLFADTKFISIFSLLFGAGIAMMSERMEQRGISGTSLHYRRNVWLLAMGLVHAYLIWHGDILVTYALCGFLLYPLRNLEPRKLLWIGGCAVALVVPLWSVAGGLDSLLAGGGSSGRDCRLGAVPGCPRRRNRGLPRRLDRAGAGPRPHRILPSRPPPSSACCCGAPAG